MDMNSGNSSTVLKGVEAETENENSRRHNSSYGNSITYMNTTNTFLQTSTSSSSRKVNDNNTTDYAKTNAETFDQSAEELHDMDDIPTLDDLGEMEHSQDVESQKWEELPPMKELVQTMVIENVD